MQKAVPYPVDDAVLIGVSLLPLALGQWHADSNGQRVGVTRAIPCATTIIDLRRRLDLWVSGPFDLVFYYLSAAVLENIALHHGLSRLFRVREAFFIEDLVIAQITRRLLAAIGQREPLDGLGFEDMAMVLGAHILQRHAVMTAAGVPPTRGLEAWQKVRSEDLLRAHLEGTILVRDLASACALSESHFARCFRLTFGTSVHQRVIQLRIERAKDLLRRTRKSLAEIALMAGFCDQAALTRTFSRVERLTPARWRRANQETIFSPHRFEGRERQVS